jgi:predicted nucleic acid-binding protein
MALERIYLDTNAFYFFFFEHEGYTPGIRKVLGRMHEGECTGVTSCLALDELAYVVLMRSIERRYGRNPREVLRGSRAAVVELAGLVQEVFDVVLSLRNLEVVDVGLDEVGTIPLTMARTGLLPRDCLHLKAMREAGCTRILSTDADFDGVEGVERIRPEGVR